MEPTSLDAESPIQANVTDAGRRLERRHLTANEWLAVMAGLLLSGFQPAAPSRWSAAIRDTLESARASVTVDTWPVPVTGRGPPESERGGQHDDT